MCRTVHRPSPMGQKQTWWLLPSISLVHIKCTWDNQHENMYIFNRIFIFKKFKTRV
ncbi:hypothetical protein QJS10_CPB17g00646 [Acorus calamus]|uniref:Uncharacterized protein n=1 Tax=Acorus calamus TaxID=4465 RepID=A0AAV9CVI5_ACOCL|nr:hypothetical protein QJS10_CPB17g00646 [Acorus calamus]